MAEKKPTSKTTSKPAAKKTTTTKKTAAKKPAAKKPAAKKTPSPNTVSDAITRSTKKDPRSRFSEDNRKRALEKDGELPHEFLMRIARGEPVKQHRLVITLHKRGPKAGKEASREWVEEEYYAGFDQRIDCAKAAAPYCAPRFANVEPDPGDKKPADKPSGVMVVPMFSMEDWEAVTSQQQTGLKKDVKS